MNVFKLPGKRLLKPAWEFTTNGLIWRVVPGGPLRLVGEERDPDRKSVRYFCIDVETGRPLWRDVSFGEQWWTGIEAIRDGVMLLHGFTTPELPEHCGLTAVNLEKGEIVWSDPGLSCIRLRGATIVAMRRRAVDAAVLELDLHSGEVTGTGRREDPADVRETPEVDDGVLVPHTGLKSPAAEETLRTSTLFQTVAAPVEVLEAGPILVAVRYESTASREERKDRFKSSIALFDIRTRELLFSDSLHDESTAIVPEVVFVWDGVLYYLKSRRTICAVRLPLQRES